MISPAAGAPARDAATFEIKSASLSLVALLLKSTDIDELAREFESRFAATPEIFDHEPLVVDLSALPEGTTALDFPALLYVLRRHRLSPVAIRGGDSSLAMLARAAGLASAPDVRIGSNAGGNTSGNTSGNVGTTANAGMGALFQRAAQTAQANAEAQAAGTTSGERAAATSSVDASNATSASPAAAAPPAPRIPPGAMLIDKPLRSGQRVYARDNDLVIMAMVNSGAEVAADGNIHVYAPLRGRALAGARGYTDARILTLCMEPELVAIAGIYRTSEKPLPADIHGKAAQVRLDGEKLLINPLLP